MKTADININPTPNDTHNINNTPAHTEVWKPIKGYEKYYEVSNYGRVRSLRTKTRIKDKTHRILKFKHDTHGYRRVNIYKNGKAKSALVHRMVAEAFIPNPHDLPHVGHDDDCKINNHISNLYWTDSKENNHHNGKMDKFQETHKRKMPQIIKKLSQPVLGTNIETGEIIIFPSMREAQRNGFCKVSQCCSGQRKTCGGYTWQKI